MSSPPSSKGNLTPKLIRLALTVILLGWVIRRVGFTQVVDALRGVNLVFILLSMLVYQMGVALRSARWWMLLQDSSIQVTYGYVLGLNYSSEFFNGILPTYFAGDLLRIIEFERGNSKVVAAGSVFLDRALGLTGLIAVALAALSIGYQQLPKETALGLALIALLILSLIAAILQGSIVSRAMHALPDLFQKLRQDWLGPLMHTLTDMDRGRLSLAFGLSIFNTLLTVINHYLVALAVGIRLGIGLFFIFSPTVNLSLLLPTISGLGLREAGYQFFLEPLGVSASVAVALGIGVFLSRLSASLIGGLYYLYSTIRR